MLERLLLCPYVRDPARPDHPGRTDGQTKQALKTISFTNLLLFFIMFCYVLLCFVMFCYVLLCFAMFCSVRMSECVLGCQNVYSSMLVHHPTTGVGEVSGQESDKTVFYSLCTFFFFVLFVYFSIVLILIYRCLQFFGMFGYVLQCFAMFAMFCYVFAMFCYVFGMFCYVLLCFAMHALLQLGG